MRVIFAKLNKLHILLYAWKNNITSHPLPPICYSFLTWLNNNPNAVGCLVVAFMLVSNFKVFWLVLVIFGDVVCCAGCLFGNGVGCVDSGSTRDRYKPLPLRCFMTVFHCDLVGGGFGEFAGNCGCPYIVEVEVMVAVTLVVLVAKVIVGADIVVIGELDNFYKRVLFGSLTLSILCMLIMIVVIIMLVVSGV